MHQQTVAVAGTSQNPKCAEKGGRQKVVVSWHSTTARSWPDPNLNNRWPGVVPRYFPINPNSATTFGTRGCRTVETRRGQNRCRRYRPNPQVPRKGGRQKVVVSGRSTTALSWPDPSLNNRWPGVAPRYFPINPQCRNAWYPWCRTGGTRRGQNRCQYPPKPKCPENGVGKKWFGTGIPADFCDDGAGWTDHSLCRNTTNFL